MTTIQRRQGIGSKKYCSLYKDRSGTQNKRYSSHSSTKLKCNDVPVFENIEQIFDYNMWFSTKRNQHRISCGSLGDFLKRVLGMGYASLTSGNSSGGTLYFEEKQWEEPIVLRFNGKEVKVFLKVDSDTWAHGLIFSRQLSSMLQTLLKLRSHYR